MRFPEEFDVFPADILPHPWRFAILPVALFLQFEQRGFA
jgi:hypothetical protein